MAKDVIDAKTIELRIEELKTIFSAEELGLVRSALGLLKSSVTRAINNERSEQVKEYRRAELRQVDSIMSRFP